jgi:hypothetical protein
MPLHGRRVLSMLLALVATALALAPTSTTAQGSVVTPAVDPRFKTCETREKLRRTAFMSNGQDTSTQFPVRVKDTAGNSVWCFSSGGASGGLRLKACDGSDEQLFRWSGDRQLFDVSADKDVFNLAGDVQQGQKVSQEGFSAWKLWSTLSVSYKRYVEEQTQDATKCPFTQSYTGVLKQCGDTALKDSGVCLRGHDCGRHWTGGGASYKQSFDKCVQDALGNRAGCTVRYTDVSTRCLVNENGAVKHYFDCRGKQQLELYDGPWCGCGTVEPTSPKGE